MTKWICAALCFVSMQLLTSKLAAEIVCVCPQADLWQPVTGTSAYWVYRYTRDDNDMDCGDDALDADLYYDATGYSPLPSEYCADVDPCTQCVLLDYDRPHLPETDYHKKPWDSPLGINGKWDVVRTIYIKFNTAKDSPVRYAKLFLLTHPRTRMMLGYGFEIEEPDASQVDPTTILTVGPNRCPAMTVYFRTGPNEVSSCVTSAMRKVMLGNVAYFVRAEYDSTDKDHNSCPTQPQKKGVTLKSQPGASVVPASSIKETTCCQKLKIVHIGPAKAEK